LGTEQIEIRVQGDFREGAEQLDREAVVGTICRRVADRDYVAGRYGDRTCGAMVEEVDGETVGEIECLSRVREIDQEDRVFHGSASKRDRSEALGPSDPVDRVAVGTGEGSDSRDTIASRPVRPVCGEGVATIKASTSV